MYFDKIQNHVELTCQFSTDNIHDLLRFIIFISEIIYINIFQKKINHFLVVKQIKYNIILYIIENIIINI